jgi:hypothetical protein
VLNHLLSLHVFSYSLYGLYKDRITLCLSKLFLDFSYFFFLFNLLGYKLHTIWFPDFDSIVVRFSVVSHILLCAGGSDFSLFFFSLLAIKPRTSHILGKRCTMSYIPNPRASLKES